MSDHFSGPRALAGPHGDICDLYAFPSPERPGQLVLVMNVLPRAGPSDFFSDAITCRFRLRPVTIVQQLASGARGAAFAVGTIAPARIEAREGGAAGGGGAAGAGMSRELRARGGALDQASQDRDWPAVALGQSRKAGTAAGGSSLALRNLRGNYLFRASTHCSPFQYM